MRAALLLRVTTGLVVLYHGTWILAAAWWPPVLAAMGLPAAALPVVAALEIVAGAAILTGRFTRIAALALLPWYAAWGLASFGRVAPTGWVLPAALVGALVSLLVLGPGPFALRPYRGEEAIAARLRRAAPFGLFPLRVALATVILDYGIDKIVGWERWVGNFEALGLPVELLPLVAAIEIATPLALLLGVLPRAASVAMSGVLATAIATAWWPLPPGAGWDLDVLLIGGLLTIALAGPGRPTLGSMLRNARVDVEEAALARLAGR